MSTNAESAKKWVEQNKPNTPTLLNFIQKLEERLDKMSPEDPSWDGNEEAMLYLESLIEKTDPKLPEVSANLTTQENEQASLDTSSLHGDSTYTPNWDASSLTPQVDVQPELSADKKREIFEQMKQKVKLVL